MVPGERRRALGSWLDGPPRAAGDYPGRRLGLPVTGRGSLAGLGPRLGALVVDLAVSSLVGWLIVQPHSTAAQQRWNLVSDGVFVVLSALLLMQSGRTLGMRLLGLQVVRLDGRTVGPRALWRQLLVGLLIPALLWDRDRRGLPDRSCRTAVVRVR